MAAEHLAADEPFFREWRQSRAAEKRRGRRRAHDVAVELGLMGVPGPQLTGAASLSLPVPLLTVVGSKGKGTAVAHASSVLAAAGLRVGTVTSPPFRSNRERIRIQGQALTRTAYRELSAAVALALARLPPSPTHYLAPTGLYTVAGVWWLLGHGVQVLVLEEGLGGLSDEVSLFAPDLVAVTPIFGEHLGLLGENVAEVAADLLGVIRPTTRLVVTARQSPEVDDILRRTVATAGAGEIRQVAAASDHHRALGELGAANASVGATAAQALATDLGLAVPAAMLAGAGARVTLPGRLSVHPPTGARQGTWVIDSAIDPVGVRHALAWCRQQVGQPDLVLASFPDDKSPTACFAALSGLPTVAVRAGPGHLRFADATRAWVAAEPALASAQATAGVVLCVGTASFIAQALTQTNTATDAWWTVGGSSG